MSLIDIPTAHPCSQNNAYAIRTRPHFCKKFYDGNLKRLPFSPGKGKKFSSGKVEVLRGGLVISAVATFKCVEVAEVTEQLSGYQNLRMGFDSKSSTPTTTEKLSADEDSAELDEREKLRRMRISKANKGNTPWNKGRKHSAETLRRIKEKTRLAMQDPKVKMKLVNLGHAQSEETRVKIGIGVRVGWEKRREKLMLQETCYYEWQNLIADASRKGLIGQEELQWDSYAILDEQLEEEWLQSVEQRKNMPRTKGSKRAPKSLEQRRKISQAIAAKWADPTYRTRVVSALAKFHGIPEGMVGKPKRKPSGDGEPRKNVPKKTANDANEFGKFESRSKSQIQRVKLRKRKVPQFKDPLASSKLDMLKNIRAQRAAADEDKQSLAVARAKMLISESEKASKALEAAAEKSPLAQASLIETRKLIAEAIQLIESMEQKEVDPHVNGTSSHLDEREEVYPHVNGTSSHLDQREEVDPHVNGTSSHLASSDLVSFSEEEILDDTNHKEVNGSRSLGTSTSSIDDPFFSNYAMHNKVNCEIYDIPNGNKSLLVNSNDFDLLPEELNNMIEHSTFERDHHGAATNGSEQNTELPLSNRTRVQPEDDKPHNSTNTTKKWVRGRLVEVFEAS